MALAGGEVHPDDYRELRPWVQKTPSEAILKGFLRFFLPNHSTIPLVLQLKSHPFWKRQNTYYQDLSGILRYDTVPDRPRSKSGNGNLCFP